MFARHLTPYAAEKAERERIRVAKPHLALVDHVPPPQPKAEPDHFRWIEVASLFQDAEQDGAAHFASPHRMAPGGNK